MTKFEVGKEYDGYQREFGYITILRRTDKTVWVKNDMWKVSEFDPKDWEICAK